MEKPLRTCAETFSSGLFGAILVLVTLLRPRGLLPAEWALERKASLKAMAGRRADRRRYLQESA